MLSDMLQLSRPPQDSDPTQFEDPAVAKAYAVGRVLEEVGREASLGRNERLVALAMCLDAVVSAHVPDISQIVDMCQLSMSATLKAVQKLTMAGFIKVVRAPTMLIYEVQFPHDCNID